MAACKGLRTWQWVGIREGSVTVQAHNMNMIKRSTVFTWTIDKHKQPVLPKYRMTSSGANQVHQVTRIDHLSNVG